MFYALKLVVVAMITVPAALLTILGGLFDPHGKHIYGVSRLWSWSILKISGISLRITGLTHIDPKQRYIFMVNHQSNIDIPVLIQALRPFQLRWLAKKELLWVPLFGWALWAAKHITVKRTDRSDALQSLKKAKQRIASGISLVFFPEGTRSPDGRLLPFKRGGFWLALQTQTPVVPITIRGSGTVLSKGDWRIRRGEIHITVGEPLLADDYRSGKLLALSNQVRSIIAKQLDATASFLQPARPDNTPNLAENSSMKKANEARQKWNH
ncbi:MAG: lysophospholipid acyltransferase family protein [Alphaproteobacteria bacterium]